MTMDISGRLRAIRDDNGLTVADIAERTGIPKRTLDKYMLRNNASLPGFDALVSLSRGLGVSLDWLVLGEEPSSEGVQLLAQKAATETALMYFETLLSAHTRAERPFSDGEEILGMSPEEWAMSVGFHTAKAAKSLAARGVTREELLTWAAAQGARSVELVRDRFERLREDEAAIK